MLRGEEAAQSLLDDESRHTLDEPDGAPRDVPMLVLRAKSSKRQARCLLDVSRLWSPSVPFHHGHCSNDRLLNFSSFGPAGAVPVSPSSCWRASRATCRTRLGILGIRTEGFGRGEVGDQETPPSAKGGHGGGQLADAILGRGPRGLLGRQAGAAPRAISAFARHPGTLRGAEVGATVARDAPAV